MMGEDGYQIPVRDVPQTKGEDPDAHQQRAAQQRRMVSKWSREDLEDKFLRMHEENLLLKKHARKQEDKIKRMATKLLRLVSDKKKAQDMHDGKKGRDIETEEMLEDLHGRIRELEKQNIQLKEKLLVAKQQLGSQASRKSVYPHVQSRINTGIQKSPMDPRLTKSMRVTGPPPEPKPTGHLPRYGHSLLEETRADNKHLESIIQQQNEQINIYEQDVEMLKEQSKVRESEFEEDLLKIKQQMTLGQKATIQENIDVIRLQREVKEKATKLIQIQAQYSSMEDKLRGVRFSHDQVMAEMERVKTQLMEEQSRRLAAESEMRMGTTSQRTIVELQERVRDYERECEILKEANEKLVSSAFDMEREREFRQRENALRVQIAQLEATLKADVGEKGSFIDQLTDSKEAQEKLEEEHRELRITYFQMKQDYDDLKDKMQFFTKESAVDFQEIEEALMIVKQRKEKENQDYDFLQKVHSERKEDHEKLLRDLRTEHADTINELEKTRNMLFTQDRINRDYQIEVENVTHKMEEHKQEYDTRQQELAQLLDIRAVRIRKLEAQMRDVAYGTRQYKIKPEEVTEEMDDDLDELEETISLERGQNLFEIHVKRANLSEEAVRLMGDEEPSLFCTWEFYQYEIQSTPVTRGVKPEFDFTSQYVVKVDDFFLHYLQKDSCTLELHQSFGTDYRTMAACQLRMREILDKSQGRLHGTARLTGAHGEGAGISFGTVEYWVRLKVPMEQALRLYKERSKALGYIDSNIRTADQALEALDEDAAKRPADNINQLHVKVLRCSGILGRREGVQPSPYCMYKFFDFNDHDTAIVEGSNNPEYNDHKTYPVPMTADLDKYLKAKPLHVYVFDDVDPEDTYYIGLAKIPLIPLAHDKTVTGLFELTNKFGQKTGIIELSLRWQFSYLPPKAATKTLAQIQSAEEGDSVHLLPGEEEAMKVSPRPPTGQKVGPPRLRGPTRSYGNSPFQQRPDPDMLQPVPHDQSGSYAAPTHEDSHEQDPDESLVSEGLPVSGESEPLSSVSAASSARQSSTPSSGRRRSPLNIEEAALRAGLAREEELAYEEEEKTPAQLIAEELGESLTHESSGDTMFADENTVTEDEVTPRDDGGMNSDRSYAETEDSDVVVASPGSRPQSRLSNMNPADVVVIAISELSVDEDSPLMDDPHIHKLYVEYTFLGVPRQETETPYSLPKPKPHKPISFNFTKVFNVNFDLNHERRQFLASMLLPEDPDEGRIRFNIVSEPEDPEDDCEDIGFALADLHEILEGGHDLEDRDLPIWDVNDETHIANLRVTVRALQALRTIKQEMDADPSLSLEAQ